MTETKKQIIAKSEEGATLWIRPVTMDDKWWSSTAGVRYVAILFPDVDHCAATWEAVQFGDSPLDCWHNACWVLQDFTFTTNAQ